MFKLFFNCFVILFIFWCFSSVKSENMTLELVHVIFRHGLRTPSKLEAKYIQVTDPSIYGLDGFGHLTNKGKGQVYKLGRILRKRYDTFLGTYKSDEIYALSTDNPRTKMSLQLLLAGLYPPSLKNQWNNALDWDPIPYYYTPEGLDVTLAPHNCPNFTQYYARVMENSEEFKKFVSKFADFIKFMSEKTGIDFMKNPNAPATYQIGWAWSATNIQKNLNLPLPSWYTNDVHETHNEALAFGVGSMSLTYELKRLNGGTLIRKILENINENNEADKRKKIYLYSTHDLTLKGFTDALNISTFILPPFGSAIIVEKYRDNENQEYIKIDFYDQLSYKTLRIENCENFCPLQNYTKLVEGLIPTDEELNFLIGKNKEL